jgi:DNA polymerase (family 10)
MPVHNNDIADIFSEFADLLEIKGANPFRIRAYRNAARTITGQSKNINDMVRGGEDLTCLPGIGKDLAAKIKEIVETGELSKLNDLKRTS